MKRGFSIYIIVILVLWTFLHTKTYARQDIDTLRQLIENSHGKEKAGYLNSIGQVYEAMGKYDLALDYFNRALKLDRELGDEKKIGIRLNNMGEIYMKEGQYAQSLNNLTRALQIFRKYNMPTSECITLNSLGLLMQKQGHYRESLDYFNRSLEISRAHKMKPYILKSLKNISESYYRMNDYKNSLDYYKTYTALKDSMFTAEQSKQLAEFEIRYETEKKEKENAALKQKAEIHAPEEI